VFSVRSAPRLYNEDLTQLEGKSGRVLEMVVKVTKKKWQEEIRPCHEDFICDLKLQRDCDKSIARIRLVTRCVYDSELESV
jgi:hypothetical protein